MSLEILINNDIKQAMLAKDRRKLEALRAIKAALLLEKTGKDTSGGEIPAEVETKLVHKLVKQRRDSAEIFSQQGRHDLAEDELFQLSIIEAYLPAQMTEEELRIYIKELIQKTGANSLKDMGKLMGMASKELSGKADNKMVSEIIKNLLNS